MAGDWIKMRAALPTHPKVVRIASALNADRLRVIGGLHGVWCLFDAHSTDGSLTGYTPEALDELVGWQGLTRAMESVVWMVVSDNCLCLPEFEEHNGKSAKRRASETQRKREARDVRDSSASDADSERTREEKRREENIELPFVSPPAGDGSSALPSPTAIAVPDFVAAERLLAKMKTSAMTDVPPLQMIVAFVSEFGEELISETLIDAETDYAGKGWRYFEKILCSRRDKPQHRPGNRRRPTSSIVTTTVPPGGVSAAGPQSGSSKLGRFKPRNGNA